MNRSGQKFFATFLVDYPVQTCLELTQTHSRSLLEVQQLHWLIGGPLSPKRNITTLTDIRNIIATKTVSSQTQITNELPGYNVLSQFIL